MDAHKRMLRPHNLKVKVKGPGEVLPRLHSHVYQTVFPRNPWKYVESVHVAQKKKKKNLIIFFSVEGKLLPLLNYKTVGCSVNF